MTPAHETALAAVTSARGGLYTAKRTRTPAIIADAERDLQATIDDARDLGIQWGEIGSALGIARGNAYQRYRKRLSRNSYQEAEADIA